ncbi:hypothetical protein KKI24_07975 [bacterium]|nr:hypothetical protein [bacterium]
MKIAFIHYHLKPGGVTTVLKQQVEAVLSSGSALVLTGAPPPEPFPGKVVVIPGLGYDNGHTGSHADDVAESILESIFQHWKEGCDLVHVHNPLLKKNSRLLAILEQLQQKGLKLFLQIHDFAEDGRPEAYYDEAYPADCHYGVINSRDRQILLNSGLKPAGVHMLANAVALSGGVPDPPPPEGIVLYPVRAIRRKNIGEAILLSCFFRQQDRLVLTLPPTSKRDIPVYDTWKRFADRYGLLVQFEAGLHTPLDQLVRSAQSILTTSMAEGFGYSFLEGWVHSRLVWGRLLPEICIDFQRNTLQLDHMAPMLKIPLAWLDEQRFFSRWSHCLLETCRQYGHRIAGERVSETAAAITEQQWIDFGMLDETFQIPLIEEIIGNGHRRERLVKMNPFLADPGIIPQAAAVINHNRKTVREIYHPRRYAARLADIYAQVRHLGIVQRIDRKKLLAHFLQPSRFSLLKWG